MLFRSGNKGTALRGVGQLDEAVSCFHEAEDLYRGLGDRRGAAHAVLNAATVDSDRNANLAATPVCSSRIAVPCSRGSPLSRLRSRDTE